MPAGLHELGSLLEQLTEADFRRAVDLFRREEERRRRAAALAFREGDPVWFMARSGRRVAGVVDRINVRTVTVCAGDGVHWRVTPQLLQPESERETVRQGETRP